MTRPRPSISHPQRPIPWACWLLLALVTAAGPVWAQRTALLIGNAGYAIGPLANPPSDVQRLELALTAIGFRVQKLVDANQGQMKRALRDFGTQAQGAEIALFYYSGHGTQVAGENYLLPIGATIEKESDYDLEAVSANSALRQIAGARPKAAIVILDACRDNPYASVTRSASRGLGRMDAPTGTMIAFSTAPNTTASDEGHYARVLAAELRKPGLELLDVFRNTTAEVRRITGGKQEPRISEVSITDRIYLAGLLPALAPVQPAMPASSVGAGASVIAAATKPEGRTEKVTFAADVFFNLRDARVLDSDKPKLDQLAATTKGINLEVVIVVGHASRPEAAAAKDAGNALSVRRAESVKAYLAGVHGIEKNRIYTEGKAASQPVADNGTAAGRAKNQRVELEVVGTRSAN